MTNRSDVDVVIVGAGVAGIAAAKTLTARGVEHVMVEASHRIGGRGLTETVGTSEPFDLGCHWLHSASLNPFVTIADQYGFRYSKENFGRETHLDGAWQPERILRETTQYVESAYDSMYEQSSRGIDVSVYEATDRESRWASLLDYWVSLDTSVDADQVSMLDLVKYRGTDEDWPVREGYGALIARLGADLPVELNCPVESIDWAGKGVCVTTSKGTIRARRAILTVSNGVLGAGDIRFSPELPDWKLEAIASVPLGNHNRICLSLTENQLEDQPRNGVLYSADGEAWMSLRVRPFGFNHVVAVTGGRFAWWLERAGTAASVDYAIECLVNIYGSDIARQVVGHKATAWVEILWVKGAYSAALPGQHHQRARLRETVGERLHFAGEATSEEFYATAHGAYLTGIATAGQISESLSSTA